MNGPQERLGSRRGSPSARFRLLSLSRVPFPSVLLAARSQEKPPGGTFLLLTSHRPRRLPVIAQPRTSGATLEAAKLAAKISIKTEAATRFASDLGASLRPAPPSAQMEATSQQVVGEPNGRQGSRTIRTEFTPSPLCGPCRRRRPSWVPSGDGDKVAITRNRKRRAKWRRRKGIEFALRPECSSGGTGSCWRRGSDKLQNVFAAPLRVGA